MIHQSAVKLQQENQRLQAELTELRSLYELLQQSEARYRQIFVNAPISFLCISTEGNPIEMNSAAEQFFGWTIAEANKTGFNGFTETTLLENGPIASFEKAISGETVIDPPMYLDPSSTISQGLWKWTQRHYYPIRDAAGQVQEVVAVALDLTAMYKVQQKLAQERTSLLQASAQVANLLLRASDYTTVLPDVVRLLGEAVGSDRCGVMEDIGLHPTLDRPAIRIHAEWCKSDVSLSLELTQPPDGAFLWNDVPEVYETFTQGKVFNRLVADVKEPGQSLLQAQGNTSCLFVPILVNDCLWGLFSFDNCGEPRLYDEAEIAILQVAAESLAAAIARQARDEELRESECRYRTLFELSSEGILRFGYHQPIPLSLSIEEQLELCYESVYIAESNAAFARMYEYEKTEDMIGLTLNDFHDRESEVTQATMRAYVEDKHSARNTETVEFDRYGRKRYFLNSSVSTIKNNCVVSTWVSQVDITELREAQQELLEVEQKRSQQLERLNIELQQTVDSLENRDRILAATAKASNILLTGKDFDKSVNQALQIIGESINTDRIGIIENFDNPENPLNLYWKMTYEWSSAYAVSQFNCLEVLQGSYEGIEEWDKLLTQGESISCQLGEMSEPFRSEMARIGVKTLYVVPILREGKYWGSVGIDDCQEETNRSEAELSILKTAAACIGSAIQRDRIQKEILKAEQEQVAELVKVNEALKQSLGILVNDPDLDSFIGHMLKFIARQFNAPLTEYWTYVEKSNISYIDTICWQEEIIELNPQLEHPGFRGMPIPAEVIEDTNILSERKHIIQRHHIGSETDEEGKKISALAGFDITTWYTSRGLTQFVNIPLIAGDTAIGALAIYFSNNAIIPQENIELALTLARQLTLAVQLTRLAEEAKQSAIIGERNQLAREIHDTLGQSFTAIVLQLEAGRRLLSTKPEQVSSCLIRARDLAHQGIIQVQRSLWTLREKADEYRDLTAAFQRLVASLNINVPVEIKFTSSGTQPVLPASVSFNLLRIGQEALTNALKHSLAQRIDLNLIFNSNNLELQVRDDGRGFAIEILAVNSGFGIKSIQQRAEQINAEVDITTNSGKGTIITVNVPLTTI